ncbi:MAG: hypothetical protein FWD04_00790 [Conexibacteraceae bacterium]|nr:hypothetical protein [Conexibacteraceae bacterium]
MSAVSVCAVSGLGGTGVASALQARLSSLPNPPVNCDPAPTSPTWGVVNIDACRAKERVGPLTLPSNWGALTRVEQGFVLIDLERVNRGLPPILGLSASLDRLAKTGAVRHSDPPFPKSGFNSGGGIWAASGSVVAADYMWMYDDGPHGFDMNIVCTHPGEAGCWMHRDIILWKGGRNLVAGGGMTPTAGGDSYAYLVLSGHSTAGLAFTWAYELRYFAAKPHLELLG